MFSSPKPNPKLCAESIESSVELPAAPPTEPWIRAAIALGSNLGDSAQILAGAIRAIDADVSINVIGRSYLYKTAPIGPPQPDYLNACILVETTLTPRSLLQQLLKIETQFGRVRQVRWGARSLDLDLLLFGDQIVDVPGLTVPHPRLHERTFVLVPLMDIVPSWEHPILGKTIAQLLAQLPVIGVERLIAHTSNFPLPL